MIGTKQNNPMARSPAVLSWNWTILGLGALLIVALAAYRLTHLQNPKEPLVYGTVPEFSLTAQNGNTLTKSNLLGHPWIADFIFTRCAGQCPQMSMAMAALQSQLQGLENLRFVSFSVDPRWDTPDILKKYAQGYGADPKRWMFLTGTQEAVFRLSRQGFKLGVDENAPDAPNIAVEPILHSASLVLVDAQGKIRGYYNGMDRNALKRLRTDVFTVAKQKH